MTGAIQEPDRVASLLAGLEAYRPARRDFLKLIGPAESNRDPLAEFSEYLVAAILGGEPAIGRVQTGHDILLADGGRVQVKYLANSGPVWVNDHWVRHIPGVTSYALVLFEELTVVGMVVFRLDRLAGICGALGKRHPRQDTELQFTRRNWLAIRDNANLFRTLGAKVWQPSL
jgi:hypothetical protein